MFLKQPISKVFFVFCLTFLMVGCSQIELASHYTKKVMYPWSGGSKSAGTYKVGSPYKIAGRRYYPKEDFNLVQTGIASWYGPGFHGKKTANGEIYNQYAMTAAHKTLQLPAIARVTNLENGRSVIVRINDRGPYEKGRVIDLSKAAAKKLNMIKNGTARVRVQVLPKESRQVAEAAKQGHTISRVQYAEATQHRQPVYNKTRHRSDNYVAKNREPAYLTDDATMDYVPMGKVSASDDLPESLYRPVITTRQVELENDNYGKNIDLPNWNKTEYAVRPVPKEQVKVKAQRQEKKPSLTIADTETDEKGFYVQVGAFSVYDNANKLDEKLSKIAPVHISEIDVQNRRLYRVRLGPVKTVEEAKAVEQGIKGEGYNDPVRIVEKR